VCGGGSSTLTPAPPLPDLAEAEEIRLELLGAMDDLDIDGDIAAQQKSREPSRQASFVTALGFLPCAREHRHRTLLCSPQSMRRLLIFFSAPGLPDPHRSTRGAGYENAG